MQCALNSKPGLPFPVCTESHNTLFGVDINTHISVWHYGPVSLLLQNVLPLLWLLLFQWTCAVKHKTHRDELLMDWCGDNWRKWLLRCQGQSPTSLSRFRALPQDWAPGPHPPPLLPPHWAPMRPQCSEALPWLLSRGKPCVLWWPLAHCWLQVWVLVTLPGTNRPVSLMAVWSVGVRVNGG